MAYEYRSGSQTLELPNPYAVENKLRFAIGAVVAAIAIALLFSVRAGLSTGWSGATLLPLLCALLLLGYAVSTIAVAMMQLRFFFGRDRPGNLIPTEVNSSAPSNNQIGAYLREIVRRGALHFPEPKGAINGLLYYLQPNLIFAPAPLQELVQAQFRSALAIAAIFISFILSWILLGQAVYAQWLGAMYFVLMVLIVFSPVRRTGAASASYVLPIVLTLAAVLGPVVITLIAPPVAALKNIQLFGATLAMLALTGIATLLFFFALRAQLDRVTPASSSIHQLPLSMNCQPSQLLDELTRRLQEQWREQIPNRNYALLRPEINMSTEASGTFASELLEETQPIPEQFEPVRSFRECFSDPRRKLILILQLFGSALLILAAVFAGLAVWLHSPTEMLQAPAGTINTLLFTAVFFLVGAYSFRGAHALFGRFDFESRLYWFECSGNYQIASLDYGNVLADRLKTRKSLINVETATLRVWIVDLHSTAYDSLTSAKNKWGRYATAMIGCKQDAQALAESLAKFAQEQSIVVAPTSAQDAVKAEAMAALGTNGKVPPEIAAGLLGNDGDVGAN
jgi:MFS family permease